jgi:gluconate 2-dehydrogenase gamma chain
MKVTRRNFIKTGTLALGSSMFLFSCRVNKPGYYFFTEEEAACIIALCEQIIPADHDPGATDAGVIHYIDKQLVEYFKDQQSLYRAGISAVQQTSASLHGKPFQDLAFEVQLDFMKTMEAGKFEGEQWKDVKQANFFNTLVNHTMQGFYGSPRHGGNKDYVSYAMMGLEYPLVIGQNRYKELN